MLDSELMNASRATMSVVSFAETRSVRAQDPAHGSFSQQPRKGGDVKLQVYQELFSKVHSRGGMSSKLLCRKEALYRFSDGQIP